MVINFNSLTKQITYKINIKILINYLEILITEIDAELIRYRKLKDINRVLNIYYMLVIKIRKRFHCRIQLKF